MTVEESPHDTVAYVSYCDIVVNEFKPLLCYYVHFQTNI